MKTLKDLKQAMTIDTQWEFEAHWQPDPVVRTVKQVQANGVGLSHPTKDSISWLYWPKASEIDFSGDSFSIKDAQGRRLYYRKVGTNV